MAKHPDKDGVYVPDLTPHPENVVEIPLPTPQNRLLELARACWAYHLALATASASANRKHVEKYRTVRGESLDELYGTWLGLAQAALANAGELED